MPMKRSTSWSIVVVMVVLASWSASVIYREYFSGESEVYLAYLDGIDGSEWRPNVAFLSSPGTCRIDEKRNFPGIPIELRDAFLSANKGAVPRHLYALTGIYNTVSYEDAIKIHRSGSLKYRPTEKRIMKLSRVGFDLTSSQALFCVEAPDIAFLIFMVKQNGLWKENGNFRIWGH